MLILGLTGGIACGKTLITQTLQEVEHIPVLDCDLIARQVVEPGTAARKQLVEAFKDDVPDLELPDGSLNRKALGRLVFNNEEKRKVLQSITGKAIFAKLLQAFLYHWLVGTPLLVVDAPTLYETKFLVNFCSEILVVALSRETQLQRLMDRDGSTKEDAMARIQAQMPIEEKVKMANVVLWNEGTREELVAKVRQEAKRLKSKSQSIHYLLFSGPGMLACIGSAVFAWRKLFRA